MEIWGDLPSCISPVSPRLRGAAAAAVPVTQKEAEKVSQLAAGGGRAELLSLAV